MIGVFSQPQMFSAYNIWNLALFPRGIFQEFLSRVWAFKSQPSPKCSHEHEVSSTDGKPDKMAKAKQRLI